MAALLTVTMGTMRGEEGEKKEFVSEWTRLTASLGSMQVDGTLRLKWTLEIPSELKTLGLKFSLEHRVETDFQGRARSVWEVNGLRSLFVPDSREYLRWQPLSGLPVRFERANVGRAFSPPVPGRWMVREAAPHRYELRAGDGRSWRYERGQLVSGNHPAMGELRFVTQGAFIREINEVDAPPDAIPLLRATYDAVGRITELTLRSGSSAHFAWNEAGELRSWRMSPDKEMIFSYRTGLLVEIQESGQPARELSWAENPGSARGDSRWAAPVHLRADGRERYEYTLTAKGFILRRQTNGSEGEIITQFNPRRRFLEQRTQGQIRRVWFRQGEISGMMLDRIENGAGSILEAYRYDSHGLLVGIQREGEPERILSYDEAGRLMALEEKTYVP